MIKKLKQAFCKWRNNHKESPVKILVIEDNKVDARIIENTLQKNGYDVTLAQNGEEGYRIAQNEIPQVIVLDFFLPGQDGLEVCRRLKDNSDTKDIPIFILTSNKSGSNILELLDQKIEGYIQKPLVPQDLITRIEEALDGKSKNG